MGFFFKLALQLITGISVAFLASSITNYLSNTEAQTTADYQSNPDRRNRNSRFDSNDSIPVQPNYNCIICLESFVPPLEILPCSHIFHKSCIKFWFDCKKTCPICGYQLTETQIETYTNRL